MSISHSHADRAVAALSVLRVLFHARHHSAAARFAARRQVGAVRILRAADASIERG